MSRITLHITRGDAYSVQRIETFEVPYREGMSLLDALLWVREFRDPSLSVRYSCRSANACKECMASVNGKSGYLCSIRAVEDTEVLIAPVPGLPLIKDIVTSIE
jgi:succinate dehydrogenase/fumarate reductase-like Fe-S protein